MNILFVVPYVPSPVRVRPYNLIRSLVARGHHVSVLTLWSNERELAEVNELKASCQDVMAFPLPRWRSLGNCLAALPTTTPLQSAFCWQPALAKHMLSLVSQNGKKMKFDVIHVEHLRGARYGLYLKSKFTRQSSALPIVWDSVDSISFLFKQAALQSKRRLSRWMTRFELGRTEKYEGWLLNQFDRVLVTSSNDEQNMRSLVLPAWPEPSISVLPNGVDLSYFTPAPSLAREPDTLVVSGKMSYHANVSMVLYLVNDIMPLVWARRPEVRVCIVGKDPPREIVALSANPTISVTGTVPEIRPYLQRATLAVAPITYGAGVQNKVLEAMACGTPVVSSPLAVSALKVIAGEDVIVVQKPAEFAKAILLLLEDDQQRQQLGKAGRVYVEKNHQWSLITEQLEQTYLEVIDESVKIS